MENFFIGFIIVYLGHSMIIRNNFLKIKGNLAWDIWSSLNISIPKTCAIVLLQRVVSETFSPKLIFQDRKCALESSRLQALDLMNIIHRLASPAPSPRWTTVKGLFMSLGAAYMWNRGGNPSLELRLRGPYLRICPHRWHRCVSPEIRDWWMGSSCFQSQADLVRAWCPQSCWHCWPHLAARDANENIE